MNIESRIKERLKKSLKDFYDEKYQNALTEAAKLLDKQNADDETAIPSDLERKKPDKTYLDLTKKNNDDIKEKIFNILNPQSKDEPIDYDHYICAYTLKVIQDEYFLNLLKTVDVINGQCRSERAVIRIHDQSKLLGCGVLIDPTHVVTARSVIRSIDKSEQIQLIQLTPQGPQELKARAIVSEQDLALITLETKAGNFWQIDTQTPNPNIDSLTVWGIHNQYHQPWEFDGEFELDADSIIPKPDAKSTSNEHLRTLGGPVIHNDQVIGLCIHQDQQPQYVNLHHYQPWLKEASHSSTFVSTTKSSPGVSADATDLTEEVRAEIAQLLAHPNHQPLHACIQETLESAPVLKDFKSSVIFTPHNSPNLIHSIRVLRYAMNESLGRLDAHDVSNSRAIANCALIIAGWLAILEISSHWIDDHRHLFDKLRKSEVIDIPVADEASGSVIIARFYKQPAALALNTNQTRVISLHRARGAKNLPPGYTASDDVQQHLIGLYIEVVGEVTDHLSPRDLDRLNALLTSHADDGQPFIFAFDYSDSNHFAILQEIVNQCPDLAAIMIGRQGDQQVFTTSSDGQLQHHIMPLLLDLYKKQLGPED